MAVLKKEFIDRMAETGGITKKAARQGVEFLSQQEIIQKDRRIAEGGLNIYEIRRIRMFDY